MLNTALIISTLLLVIFSFALGVFSLYTNPKSRVVQLWFLMSMAVGVWSLGYLVMLLSTVEVEVILYSRLLHVGATFIPIFFCHFVLTFLFKAQEKKIFLAVGYLLAIIFTVLSLWGSYLVSGASPKVGIDWWYDAGSFYPIFLIFFWFYALAAIYFLFKAYRERGGVLKKKTFYILLAAIIGFVGGGTSFLPATLGIFPWGHFITWLYPVIITYGIFIKD
jgi:hypothetical protein